MTISTIAKFSHANTVIRPCTTFDSKGTLYHAADVWFRAARDMCRACPKEEKLKRSRMCALAVSASLVMEELDTASNKKDQKWEVGTDFYNRIVGCIATSRLKNENTLSIDYITVSPYCAQKGLGTFLINHVEHRCRDEQIGRIIVRPPTVSLAFFTRLGFLQEKGLPMSKTLDEIRKYERLIVHY